MNTWGKVVGVAAVALAMVATTLLMTYRSTAAFSAIHHNAGNSAQAGEIHLTDDDSGSVMFDSFGSPNDGYLTMGQTLPPRCIAINYSGTWSGGQFSDDFQTIDSLRWNVVNSPAVTLVGGQLHITPQLNSPSGLQAVSAMNFSNKVAQIDVPQVPGDSGEIKMRLTRSQFEWIEIGIGWNDLIINESWGEFQNYKLQLPGIGQVATKIRLQTVGNTVLWQYSVDGQSWTTAASRPAQFPLDALHISLISDYWWDAYPALRPSIVDNLLVSSIVNIRLYAQHSGNLAPGLSLTIQRGHGGGNSSCAGFTPDETLFNGVLADMPANYLTSALNWIPTSANQSSTYRITASVLDDMQWAGKTAQATFTWEAQAG